MKSQQFLFFLVYVICFEIKVFGEHKNNVLVLWLELILKLRTRSWGAGRGVKASRPF